MSLRKLTFGNNNSNELKDQNDNIQSSSYDQNYLLDKLNQNPESNKQSSISAYIPSESSMIKTNEINLQNASHNNYRSLTIDDSSRSFQKIQTESLHEKAITQNSDVLENNEVVQRCKSSRDIHKINKDQMNKNNNTMIENSSSMNKTRRKEFGINRKTGGSDRSIKDKLSIGGGNPSDNNNNITQKRNSIIKIEPEQEKQEQNRKLSKKETKRAFYVEFQTDKKKWIKRKECFFCYQKFSFPTIGEHHCRICSKSVCQNCSSNKYKLNRVCDICFYRINHEEFELDKEEALKNQKDYINSIKQKTSEYNNEVHDSFLYQSRQLSIAKEENAKIEKKLNEEHQELEKLKFNLKMKKRDIDCIEEKIPRNIEINEENSKKIREFLVVYNGLLVVNDTLGTELQNKNNKREKLRNYVDEIKNCKKNMLNKNNGGDNNNSLLSDLIEKNNHIRTGKF